MPLFPQFSAEQLFEIRGESEVRAMLKGANSAEGELRDQQDDKIDFACKASVDRAFSILRNRYEDVRLNTVDLEKNTALSQTLADLAFATLSSNRAEGLSEETLARRDAALQHLSEISRDNESLRFDDPAPSDISRPRILTNRTVSDRKFGPGFMGWNGGALH